MQRAEPQDFERVLSSMCTAPHPAAREAAVEFLATNPGDPGTYQSVAALERDAVERLGDVTNLADPAGYVTSGGTEANVQALRIARNRARDGAPTGSRDCARTGGPTANGTGSQPGGAGGRVARRRRRPNVVVPDSAHFSFTKAGDVLGVEIRRAPLDSDYRTDVDGVVELVDDGTVCVVGVAGSTEYGRIDPIPALAEVAADAGALLHVDAAWGGFVLPFTDHAWDFSDAAVDTMTIDPHKLGQAAVPAGGLLARSPALLDALAIDTPYLESHAQVTLTGTRSGAGVASAVAAMDALWPDGYREAFERMQSNADWLASELAARGYDVVDPTLPLVAASVPHDVVERLREHGWRVARTAAGELRVVLMPHVTREMLSTFLADLDRLR